MELFGERMGELELKVKIANQILDAYPTDNYVYEVSYCGKKEFFQNAYDAFESDMFLKESKGEANVTRIYVKPASEENREFEAACKQLGFPRFPYPKQIDNFQKSKFYYQRLWIRENADTLFFFGLWGVFLVFSLVMVILSKG